MKKHIYIFLGHSTNTQTQSVPIHPWRSGETPLASIRPMSQQLRTVTVLPTSQSPSAVMVPPQQQVWQRLNQENKNSYLHILKCRCIQLVPAQ
jgi:hypothetical protein